MQVGELLRVKSMEEALRLIVWKIDVYGKEDPRRILKEVRDLAVRASRKDIDPCGQV